MRVYNAETIGFINLFESITKARTKDCFANEKIMFVVHEGEAGKAIGKNGLNIQRIRKLLKRDIKIVEFNTNPIKFVENLIYPARGIISQEEDIISISVRGARYKEIVLGRERKNLKEIEEIVSKYFNVKIKVV